ncbi:MAG: hypothetical protein A2521_14055 [Deltaproteobacteria bacterium RIFOXYD12_FULL_57_12]|nr:MAG: hypothetical protein A2521_14055 [Deltaproteobacteria bacterium RIFOXYD12_FULL_57_12]
MALWKFTIIGNTVSHGTKQRQKLTHHGCNEPFKDSYWCPKLQWFRREACPFISRNECENFDLMCGSHCG